MHSIGVRFAVHPYLKLAAKCIKNVSILLFHT